MPTDSVEEDVPLVLRAIEALERKDYAVGIGLLLMIATFVMTRVPVARNLVPKQYVASALLGAALIGAFGSALASGMPVGRAALAFLLCSASAIAFWEGIAKHVVRLVAQRKRRTSRAADGIPGE